jgi:hypothetical protein
VRIVSQLALNPGQSTLSKMLVSDFRRRHLPLRMAHRRRSGQTSSVGAACHDSTAMKDFGFRRSPFIKNIYLVPPHISLAARHNAMPHWILCSL